MKMDKINMKVEVKTTSRETVKPSIPTHPECKDFILSYLDQILPLVPPFLTCGILFYTNTPLTQNYPIDHVNRLKISLSKTLTTFYPLAGRINQDTITCNDEGIPFFQTKVNCPISHVLNSTPMLDSLIVKFLPPRDSLGIPVGVYDGARVGVGIGVGVGVGVGVGLAHLAIQINVFTCGGVAIGWYDIHKVMDGTSSATFFKHWAALANQKFHEVDNLLLVQPNFDAAIKTFPPSCKTNLLELESAYKNHNKVPIVFKSFIFSNKAINEIKAMGASELIPNPTRFQALSGFIWEQLISVSQNANFDHMSKDDNILLVTVDMRPFTSPPLPQGSIGNLVNSAVARADKYAKLPSLVVEIQAAVTKMKHEIRKYDGVEGVRTSLDNLNVKLADYKEKAYKIVSWCKLGFSDLDFGFGKPNWMVPTDGIMSPFHRNLVILTDFMDTSIEAWIFLEEKQMKILESTPQFIDFTSSAYKQ